MIKLKDILKDIPKGDDDQEKIKAKGYSWQRSDGTFKPIKNTHGTDAWNMLGQPVNTDSVEILWNRGWNRIWYNGTTLFCHNEMRPPSDKQKKALIDLAIELGSTEVQYDAGEGSQILWSTKDTLEENLRKQG